MGTVSFKSPRFVERAFPPGSWPRRLAIWIGAPLLIVLLLALIADQIVMPIVTRQGAEFELPNFTNKMAGDVQLDIEEMNLMFEISGEEYAPGTERGLVLRQYPIPGTQVKPGRIIKFVISMGTKMIKIPEVAGKSVRQAMLDLEGAGLTLGEIAWAVSDTIPEKVVVFSYPNAGIEVPLGSAVNLMVNRGRASDYTYMPKLVGMSLRDATNLLEEKGLVVGLVTHRVNENYLPDTILEQSEVEGAELTLGTSIDLVASET